MMCRQQVNTDLKRKGLQIFVSLFCLSIFKHKYAKWIVDGSILLVSSLFAIRVFGRYEISTNSVLSYKSMRDSGNVTRGVASTKYCNNGF